MSCTLNDPLPVVPCRARPSTLDALDKIGGPTPLAWGQHEWTFGKQFQRLLRLAGIKTGSFKWMRRSSGSYVEALMPGAGHKQLGHKDEALFSKHYDAKLVAVDYPMPPEL